MKDSGRGHSPVGNGNLWRDSRRCGSWRLDRGRLISLPDRGVNRQFSHDRDLRRNGGKGVLLKKLLEGIDSLTQHDRNILLSKARQRHLYPLIPCNTEHQVG